MADRHGRIFMHQHHRGRPSDHEAPSDDGGTLSGKRDPVVLQDLHRGLRRAGRKAERRVREHTGKRAVRAAVDVLFRREHPACLLAVQMFRERPEHQDAVDARVAVQRFQRCKENVSLHVCRKHDVLHGRADLFAALHRAAFVA